MYYQVIAVKKINESYVVHKRQQTIPFSISCLLAIRLKSNNLSLAAMRGNDFFSTSQNIFKEVRLKSLFESLNSYQKHCKKLKACFFPSVIMKVLIPNCYHYHEAQK